METAISPTGIGLRELVPGILGLGTLFRFAARGSSMFPFVRDRDVITVAPLRGNVLTHGDIALFLHPDSDRVVVHRIVSVEADAFLIRGDCASAPDGLIPAALILGRVSVVERNGRTVRLGQGPEKHAIAFLSRTGALAPLVRFASRLKRLIVPRQPAA